jgi:hypothetical protein
MKVQMREYRLTSDDESVMQAGDHDAESVAQVLRRFEPGHIMTVYTGKNAKDTAALGRYLADLRAEGLEIEWREDAEFGWKMPVPDTSNPLARLQVFRRR